MNVELLALNVSRSLGQAFNKELTLLPENLQNSVLS